MSSVFVQLHSKINTTSLANGFEFVLSFETYMKKLNETPFERGDSSRSRQISRVEGCALKRIGNLEIDMKYATCTATEDEILMCFPYNSNRKNVTRIV